MIHQHAKFQGPFPPCFLRQMSGNLSGRTSWRKTQMYCDENRWRFFCQLRIIQESGVYQLEVPQGQGDSSASSTTHPLIDTQANKQTLHERTEGRTDGQTDGHATKRSRLVGWTIWPMYRWNEGISGFGRMGGQPENICLRCLKVEA